MRLGAGGWGLGTLLAIAACSHNPAPDVAAEPDSPPPVPIAADLSPARAAGGYRLTARIESARAHTRGSQSGFIQLSSTPAAAPIGGSAPGTQFNATVSLSGYTRAPRGRPGQAGAWWPIGGDSVVVEFTGVNAGEIQLRGLVRGRSITGEVWYISAETGSGFQMGTFAATKRS